MSNTKNKMLIDAAHPEETRVVVLRNGRIEEFDWESSARKLLRGNIYLAKVTRVEPSLQAAFVDYGGNRHGFLAFSEIHPDYYQIPMADRQALLAEEAEAEEAKAQAEAAEDAALSEGEDVGDDHADYGPGEFPSGSAPAADQRLVPAIENTSDENPSAPSSGADDEHGMHSSMPLSVGGPQAADDRLTASETWMPAAQPATAASTLEPHSSSDDADKAPEFAPEHVRSTEPFDQVSDGDRSLEDGSEAGSRVVEVVEPEGSGATEVETVGSEDVVEEIPDRPRRFARQYKIQEVIRRRQIILVQVVKEERGNKGAALTTYLSLAGRYTVLMPNTARGGGISRKIANSADRKRLRKIVTELEVPKGMGLIVRTAGASRTKAEIKRDFEYLLRLWESVRDLTLRSTAPALVYEEGDLIKRSIRDLYSKEIDEIVVAGEHAHANARDFMQMLMPSHVGNVIPFRSPEPLFTKFQIERQLNAMFSPFVTLRSGGYIVINQTEALVSVDVNSGKATREHSIEDTALKTNLEASEEVARQLKLRDLAGLIVIDYIDMEEKRNNRAVERRLKECLRHDRARIQVGRISHFGLLEMSRQRLRPGVLEGSTSQCPHCQGTGTIRSTESVALGVLRGIEDKMISGDRYNIVAQTTPDVALYILNQKRHFLNDMESRYGVTITILASDKVHGANYVIERGPANEERLPVRRTDVVQMDASHHGPTGSLEADATDEDFDEDRSESGDEARPDDQEEARAETGGEAGGDSERRGRRRRRRRRGGRGGLEASPVGQSERHDADSTDDRAPTGDDDELSPSDYRRDDNDGEPGVQEIEMDGEVETIGDDGDDRASEQGYADDGSRDPRSESDRSAEGRRRRRGRRGGRRGGRERESTSAQFRPEDSRSESASDEMPIARPDDWLHREPTIGDLAAEERRRYGQDEQPAYYSPLVSEERAPAAHRESNVTDADQPSRDSGLGGDHNPASPIRQETEEFYPQVAAGAAAVVVPPHQSEAANGGDHSRGETAAHTPPMQETAPSASDIPDTDRTWDIATASRAEPDRHDAPATSSANGNAPASSGELSHVPSHAAQEAETSVEASVPEPDLAVPPPPPEPPRPRRSGWWSRRSDT